MNHDASGEYSPPAAKRARQPRFWLDEMPREVRDQIAMFAARRKDPEDVRGLAETSTAQRDAVAAAFSYKFEIVCEWLCGWSEVFREGPREVCVHGLAFKVDEYSRGILDLLQMPSLRTATVPEITELLDAIGRGGSVRTLSVSLIATDHSPLLRTLRFLTLDKLELMGDNRLYPETSLGKFLSNAAPDVLAVACPNLKSLHLGFDRMRAADLCRVISPFKNLEELNVRLEICGYALVSDALLPNLHRLQSVTLRESVHGGPYLAKKIGAPVTSLESCDVTALDDILLLELAICPRLSTLELWVRSGHEKTLAELVPHLLQLRRLTLRWEVEDRRYYVPSQGSILKIVKDAPRLEELHILQVGVSLSEITNLICGIGSRLKEFCTSITDQDESPHERLSAVMNTLSGFCRQILRFNIIDSSICKPQAETLSFDEQFNRRWDLCKALGRLQRLAYLLDDSDVERVVEKLNRSISFPGF